MVCGREVGVRGGELDAGPAEVDAAFSGFDPGHAFDGDVCCWDAELGDVSNCLYVCG